jgi:DNA-binding CsgD family transcriptional regulator
VSVHLAAGDLGAARDALARLQVLAGLRTWPEASARASIAAGRVALADHDPIAALGCFEKAMTLFSDQGLPYERARARLAIAEAATHTNRELAMAEARGALLVFDELGARRDSAAASGLLRTLGVASRPGPRQRGLLTEREREVLRLLSSGLSNPEIADRLVISRKTAAHHVSSVLSKLALRNRAEAAAYASRTSDR